MVNEIINKMKLVLVTARVYILMNDIIHIEKWNYGLPKFKLKDGREK